MSQYLTPEDLHDLYMLFLVGVALFLFVSWFVSYCRRVDTLDYHDESVAGPVPPYADKPANDWESIGWRESLRTPLKNHRNPTPPADSMDELLAKHGVSAADRADLVRGTKL